MNSITITNTIVVKNNVPVAAMRITQSDSADYLSETEVITSAGLTEADITNCED